MYHNVPQTKTSSQDVTRFSEMSISLRLLGQLLLLPRNGEQTNNVSNDSGSFNQSIKFNNTGLSTIRN